MATKIKLTTGAEVEKDTLHLLLHRIMFAGKKELSALHRAASTSPNVMAFRALLASQPFIENILRTDQDAREIVLASINMHPIDGPKYVSPVQTATLEMI